MATFKSKAIVLRTLKYSESSIIVDLLTESKGLRSFIVSGVRGKKGKNRASYFQHLNLIEVVAYDRSDGKLARISEYRLAHHYAQLTSHVVKSNLGLFVLEVTRNAIREMEENHSLFNFVWTALLYIEESPLSSLASYPLRYTLELSTYLGIYPLNDYSEQKRYFDLRAGHFSPESESPYVLSYDDSYQLYTILVALEQSTPFPALPRGDRNTLLDQLIRYYTVQLSQFPDLKSLEIIRNIL